MLLKADASVETAERTKRPELKETTADIQGYSEMTQLELEVSLGYVEKTDAVRKELREIEKSRGSKKMTQEPVLGYVNVRPNSKVA